MAGCLMDVGGYQSTYVGSGQLNHVYSLDWDDWYVSYLQDTAIVALLD